MPRVRSRTRSLAVLSVATILAGACADQTAQFCSAYEEGEPLESLFAAIDNGDAESINSSLGELEELTAIAPAEISAEVDVVLETFADTVRVATQTADPDGPEVDAAEVSAALVQVTGPAQDVERYVAERC